ncbi:hypothetical protein [Thalassovita taeanensis]|uniref:Uncharacterized protein n=1 Tax=Thalassovita taeanensis TaxID=657014 RepID=A0A1H9FEE5_9RHOB|nr:hypothetical protein [Thalassovita taeanensis]SEQ36331.1 hypothetical protein SAMN04488092_10663 [Thalassovita taeanensis]
MSDIAIETLGKTRLRLFHARVDGRACKIAMGAWAVYLPGLQMKLMHSVHGDVHCIYHKAPKREHVLAGKPVKNKVPAEEWKAAFTKPVTRRVAENYICLQRLYAAGIGPEPQGLVIVPQYRSWFSRGPGYTAGYRVANLYSYPPKAPTTEDQLRAAGIVPDRSLATIREQINGYVSDLNSVNGAMPENAEAEVAALTAHLDRAMAHARAA